MKRKAFIFYLTALFVVVSVGVIYGKSDVRTIAIASFRNLSGNPADDYLGVGISESLTTSLGKAKIPNLQVVERAQLEQVLEEVKLAQAGIVDEKEAPEIGKTLGARAMVVGSFQKVGNSFKMDARVVDVETSQIMGADSAEGTYDPGLFSLQSQLAHKIVKILDVSVSTEESKVLDSKPTNSILAYEFFSQALAHHARGELDEAIDLYLKALGIDGNYLSAYNNLGVAYLDKGQIDQAIDSVRKAISIDPNYAQAYNNLGSAYYRQGQYDLAKEAYQKALSIDPGYAFAYNNLGNVYYRQGDYTNSIESYLQALAINPDYPQALYNLATTYDDPPVGKYNDAVEAYKRVIELNPKHVNSYLNLSFIYSNILKDKEAAASYRRSYLRLRSRSFDAALILDSSGSMGRTDPKELRKEGAKAFVESIRLMEIRGANVGVVDFDDTSKIISRLRPVDEAESKAALLSAIDKINADGGTNIGGGLSSGLAVLKGGAEGAEKFAILLTDGVNEHGTPEEVDESVEDYTSRGWKVHTIGLSDQADKVLLTSIAQRTGGIYYNVDADIYKSQRNMQSIFMDILGLYRGYSNLVLEKGVVAPAETKEISVSIDRSVKETYIAMTYPGSDLDLALRTPSGALITKDSAKDNPNIEFISSGTYEAFRLINPEPGEWKALVKAVDVPGGGEPFNLQVKVDTTLEMELRDVKSSYPAGTPISFQVVLKEGGEGIKDAEVKASVVRPDGAEDKEPVVGAYQGRGVYLLAYQGAKTAGDYTFLINASGKASSGEAFQREAQSSIFVVKAEEVDWLKEAKEKADRGRWSEAFSALESALKIKPDDVDAYKLWIDFQDRRSADEKRELMARLDAASRREGELKNSAETQRQLEAQLKNSREQADQIQKRLEAEFKDLEGQVAEVQKQLQSEREKRKVAEEASKALTEEMRSKVGSLEGRLKQVEAASQDREGNLVARISVLEEELKKERAKGGGREGELSDILDRLGEFSLKTTLDSPGLADILQYEGEALPGQATDHEFPIDSSIKVAFVVAAHKAPSLRLSIYRPGRRLFRPEGDSLAINLESDGYRYQIYRLSDPEDGLWSISVDGGSLLKLSVKAQTDLLLSGRYIRDWYPSRVPLGLSLALDEGGKGLRSGRFIVSMKKEDGSEITLFQGQASSQDGLYSFGHPSGIREGGEYMLKVVAYGKTVSGGEYRREFRRRVWINPIGAPDLVSIGREEALRGNWDEAIDMAAFAVQLEPDNIEAHRDLGFYYGRKADSLASAYAYERSQLHHKAQLEYQIVDRLTYEKARAGGWGVKR